MEPALDVTGRALSGDPGACTFLDRTSSIYVLDATNASKPKTYGCWNFIHQAMNEIERYEARFASENKLSPQQALTPRMFDLTNRVKLISTLALRVARRSPNVDRKLVETCIVNAAHYHASPNQSQWLVDLNLELREIVMGRIAAMVFDFSFHKRSGAHGLSAFADSVVMENFCAVLSANAVSTGPDAISHFITDWIVPSAKSLPPYAVACVALHLPLEALRKPAPAGTKDKLQQLSSSVMSTVLAPVLADSVSESTVNGNAGGDTTDHARNNLIVAVCLRAVERWCAATELSLAQIKHICGKIGINIVDVISDAMYSDYRGSIDALADLVEAATKKETTAYVLGERMNQVRYIMQVDEASFTSSFSADQLISIETKEMESIMDELVSAIGLQRFRFVERQNNGDHDVCRSLARIAASVCLSSLRAVSQGQPLKTESGLVDMIMKAVAHASVNICGIGLEVLTQLVKVEKTLAMPLLPILQRRAITPHHMVSGAPSLSASDICGVNFHEFQNFREHLLSGALVACYLGSPDNYMDSCTSAVEEFCASDATIDVSLHLEAALFCLGTVADEALSLHHPFAHSCQLDRCIKALAVKPCSLTENPLTLAQMCLFLRKYTRWYGKGQISSALEVATELAMSTFNLSASDFPDNSTCSIMMRETSVSPFSEAALTLRELLSHSPQQFLSISAIAALGAGWEASYAASNRSKTVTITDRIALCVGICHVLAALPANQRIRSFHALALPSLDCFEKMANLANNAIVANATKDTVIPILSRIADEIQVLTIMSRTFTNACSTHDVLSMDTGCGTSSDKHQAIAQPLLIIVKKIWPAITHVAKNYSEDEKINTSLGAFLTEFLPPKCDTNSNFSLLKELCSIAFAMMENDNGGTAQFRPIFEFLTAIIKVYGEGLESKVQQVHNGARPIVADNEQELALQVKNIMMTSIKAVKSAMNAKLAIPKEQGQGQQPFESKRDQESKSEVNSIEAFAGLFMLFTMCLEKCPVFFFQLPATQESTQDADGLLYNRAVDSAISSLIGTDLQTSKAAMDFLESLVKLINSHNDEVRQIVSEAFQRIRGNLLTMLLLGSFGKISYSAIKDVSLLLHSLLRSGACSSSESRLILISALTHKYFRLGKIAGNIMLNILERAARNEITSTILTSVLEEIWELHQIDDTHFLENSDVVARFVTRYSQ